MLLQIDFDQCNILSCLKPGCCLVLYEIDSWVKKAFLNGCAELQISKKVSCFMTLFLFWFLCCRHKLFSFCMQKKHFWKTSLHMRKSSIGFMWHLVAIERALEEACSCIDRNQFYLLLIFEGVQIPVLISCCRPSSLDALVFGYIAPLLKAPLSSNQLTTHLRRYCENLCTHCNRILQQFFPPTPEGNFHLKSPCLT